MLCHAVPRHAGSGHRAGAALQSQSRGLQVGAQSGPAALTAAVGVRALPPGRFLAERESCEAGVRLGGTPVKDKGVVGDPALAGGLD